MPRQCSICADERKNRWVAARHLEGHHASAMERLSRAADSPVPNMKRETIKKHLDVCIGASDVKPDEMQAVGAAIAPTVAPQKDESAAVEDVAVLVQKRVVEKLKAGDARVTVQHGLQAQQLLDRRAERAKDRELAITLARLLHSPAPPPEAIRARPVDVIEGEVMEVTSGD